MHKLLHVHMRFDMVPQRQCSHHLIAIPPAILGYLQIAVCREFFNDSLNRSLCDAYLGCHLAHTQIAIAGNQKEYMSVVCKKIKSDVRGIYPVSRVHLI
ncbi:MAG TPA: hypothetical protein VL346_05770 [Acidobacteriaceae bacterium]|nr:hypothetical protein [Acidobacteriaceae bacterium]